MLFDSLTLFGVILLAYGCGATDVLPYLRCLACGNFEGRAIVRAVHATAP